MKLDSKAVKAFAQQQVALQDLPLHESQEVARWWFSLKYSERKRVMDMVLREGLS